MSKLTKAEKAKKIETPIVALFEENGTDVNAICTSYIKDNMEALMAGEPVQFTELEGIVRQIGLDKGYLKKLADRKDECANVIENEKSRGFYNRADFEGYVQELAQYHNVSEKWVNNEIHDIYKRFGYANIIPAVDNLKDWQRKIVDIWTDNNEVRYDDMLTELDSIEGFNSAKQYIQIVLPILQEIKKIEDEKESDI